MKQHDPIGRIGLLLPEALPHALWRAGAPVRVAAWLAAFLLAVAPVWAQEPPLPEGLGETEQREEPALPEGLGGDSESPEPALPEGLGGEAEPALPEGLGGDATEEKEAAEEAEETSWRDELPFELHGFIDLRAGSRIVEDPSQSKTATLGELRLQLESEHVWDRAVLDWRVDFLRDEVLSEWDIDPRQLRLTLTVTDKLDLRAGRQVLTWGTGDMLFINDLFPKDWESFFSGRDVEYLKAPSDAIKVGWYDPDIVNVEFVYTPQFSPDRFTTGARISYWNPLLQRFSGESFDLKWNAPSDWFEDDEFHWRLYRNVGDFQVAYYGYSGYWKSPGGQRLTLPYPQATFPRLQVHGASMRGTLGKGIFSAEFGYYDSRDDRDGDDPFVNNSELRLLIGYEQELAKNFTGSVQYYWEHMLDYGAYRDTLPFFEEPRDQDRHLFTVRLTKLLMQQNLELSFFGYYSPTDGDGYLRPRASYKVTDRWLVEGGLNIFAGESDASFFGRFKKNSNVYAGVRYSF